MSEGRITLGTRGSELALTQTTLVTEALREKFPRLDIQRQIISTAGDKRPDLAFSEFGAQDQSLRDKGIFIKELEVALESGEIDAAVHSLKDVPSVLSPAFEIAATLPRATVEDMLITRDPCTLETLKSGARVGTSSPRRARQLKWLRPDVEIVEIRGNVPTRVKKVLGPDGLDAVLLAAAGLLRLGLLNANLARVHLEGQTLCALALQPEKFLPSAGQGAIAIEVRAGDNAARQVAGSLDHKETRARVTAEREFLRLIGAGCQTPVGAHTWVDADGLHMAARVFSETDLTREPIDLKAHGSIADPKAIAHELASLLAEQGRP